jgi:hypothetical protein
MMYRGQAELQGGYFLLNGRILLVTYAVVVIGTMLQVLQLGFWPSKSLQASNARWAEKT